jgi:hypothetical protein
MTPRKARKEIENWDFIMVFEEYYRGEVELMFSSLKCQGDLQWKLVDNPLKKQVLVLMRMSEKIVIEMAHDLHILKKKNKKSYQLSPKDLNTMIYTTDRELNPALYSYLCFIKGRFATHNSEIYEQEHLSAFNKNKKDMYFKGANGKLFTPEEELRAKYHFLVTYS